MIRATNADPAKRGVPYKDPSNPKIGMEALTAYPSGTLGLANLKAYFPNSLFASSNTNSWYYGRAF